MRDRSIGLAGACPRPSCPCALHATDATPHRCPACPQVSRGATCWTSSSTRRSSCATRQLRERRLDPRPAAMPTCAPHQHVMFPSAGLLDRTSVVQESPTESVRGPGRSPKELFMLLRNMESMFYVLFSLKRRGRVCASPRYRRPFDLSFCGRWGNVVLRCCHCSSSRSFLPVYPVSTFSRHF